MPKHELPQADRVERQANWQATRHAWLNTSIVRAMAEFYKSWDNAWQRGYNIGLQVREATNLARPEPTPTPEPEIEKLETEESTDDN